MANGAMASAKKSILEVLDARFDQLDQLRSDPEAFKAAFHTLKKRVWEAAEAELKKSYRNGQDDRAASRTK